MSWIQTIADEVHVTYYEALAIVVGCVVAVLLCIYVCIIKPAIDCIWCCSIPCRCLYKIIMNPCWDCCFGRRSDNKYKRVSVEDIP